MSWINEVNTTGQLGEAENGQVLQDFVWEYDVVKYSL